jgi:Restriction endonuclease BglII
MGVLLQVTDFNDADEVFRDTHSSEWGAISSALQAVTLHLKGSDQTGIVGTPIWDAVGNNAAIKEELVARGWQPNIPIPAPYAFLGKDVDFLKSGVVVEVQFSNYPFLLNNLLRCELFFKGGIDLAGTRIEAGIIIAKAKMFAASNSTLYYEQAVDQLTALAQNNVFDVPLRLVSLFEAYGSSPPVVWTTYSAARYSRTVSTRRTATAHIEKGRKAASRAIITIT